ncbi:hypothetical protein E6C27_scaffold17G001290 [Cucumis melo var. makuwa]|uniref:Uncharacterized protein n=1 Tax=Cucumis melo var. makuwa TaxID=1194695 RepID=A0A5A7VCU0_CUCMM|nr:hypothetical protein E6C27_scaffold17G001290 [Cucumis melo var. makuwa]
MFEGFPVGKERVHVPLLQFADDTLVFANGLTIPSAFLPLDQEFVDSPRSPSALPNSISKDLFNCIVFLLIQIDTWSTDIIELVVISIWMVGF